MPKRLKPLQGLKPDSIDGIGFSQRAKAAETLTGIETEDENWQIYLISRAKAAETLTGIETLAKAVAQ